MMDVAIRRCLYLPPRRDLHRLPLGAIVSDFAFHIHSALGCIVRGTSTSVRETEFIVA